MKELEGLAWNGVPDELRPIVWQLLLVRPPILLISILKRLS